MRGSLAAAVTAATLFVAACGSGDDSKDTSFSFGEPAKESEADRTVEITIGDELAFEPDLVNVDGGEVVTFEVVNDSGIEHEFVLGDDETQREHGKEMMQGGHGMDVAYAMPLGPHETGRLTWRFDGPEAVRFGCHTAGHYEAGMVGTVEMGGSAP